MTAPLTGPPSTPRSHSSCVGSGYFHTHGYSNVCFRKCYYKWHVREDYTYFNPSPKSEFPCFCTSNTEHHYQFMANSLTSTFLKLFQFQYHLNVRDISKHSSLKCNIFKGVPPCKIQNTKYRGFSLFTSMCPLQIKRSPFVVPPSIHQGAPFTIKITLASVAFLHISSPFSNQELPFKIRSLCHLSLHFPFTSVPPS